MEAAKVQHAQLQTTVGQAEQAAQGVQANVQATTAQRDDLLAQLEQLKNRQQAAEHQSERGLQDLQNLKQEISQLREQTEIRTNGFRQNSDTLEAIQGEIQKLTADKAKLQAELPDESHDLVETLRQAETEWHALRTVVAAMRELAAGGPTSEITEKLEQRKTDVQELQAEQRQLQAGGVQQSPADAFQMNETVQAPATNSLNQQNFTQNSIEQPSQFTQSNMEQPSQFSMDQSQFNQSSMQPSQPQAPAADAFSMMNDEPVQSPVSPTSLEFNTGDVLIYTNSGEAVEVLKKHAEDYPNPPYYTIRMQDLREKQTTVNKLKRSDTPLQGPKQPEAQSEMLALPPPDSFESQPLAMPEHMQSNNSQFVSGGDTQQQPPQQQAETQQQEEPQNGNKPAPPENLTGTPDTLVFNEVLSHPHYQAAAQSVFGAYNGFFDDIRLRKNWKEVPFTMEDMKIIFTVAAQVVAVLRARLDVKRVGISLRKMDGQAPDFLWGLEKNPNPMVEGQDRSFVAMTLAGLIKATMSDGNGFVEGMDEPTVMSFVRVHPWVLQNIFGQNPAAAQ